MLAFARFLHPKVSQQLFFPRMKKPKSEEGGAEAMGLSISVELSHRYITSS
jgi:hypothetical protein